MCGAAFLSLLTGCRDYDPIPTPEPGQVQDPAVPQPGEDGYVLHGFYLLNEGNMGTNKATLDYMDFATGVYTRNIYAAANPTQPMEMGDVGNDIAIYGSKLSCGSKSSPGDIYIPAGTARPCCENPGCRIPWTRPRRRKRRCCRSRRSTRGAPRYCPAWKHSPFY